MDWAAYPTIIIITAPSYCQRKVEIPEKRAADDSRKGHLSRPIGIVVVLMQKVVVALIGGKEIEIAIVVIIAPEKVGG